MPVINQLTARRHTFGHGLICLLFNFRLRRPLARLSLARLLHRWPLSRSTLAPALQSKPSRGRGVNPFPLPC